MSKSLGTVADLPPDYYESLLRHNLLPLWPSLRAVLPYGRPARKTRPVMWRYADVRPNLLRAGELTPIEKAERRVLVLCNPGFGLENMQATPSIYIGMQLILPNEVAASHRHTPSAIRLVIEGEGAYTIVSGEKLPMEQGDLILTPPGLWHEHGHSGHDPVIWLDALDLPLIYGLDISHAQEGVSQQITDEHNLSAARYSQGGNRALRFAPQQDYPVSAAAIPVAQRQEIALGTGADHACWRADSRGIHQPAVRGRMPGFNGVFSLDAPAGRDDQDASKIRFCRLSCRRGRWNGTCRRRVNGIRRGGHLCCSYLCTSPDREPVEHQASVSVCD